MPSINTTALANIQTLAHEERADVCEYLKVTWTTGVIKYYGGAAWNDLAPFTSIGLTIEPRLIYPDLTDPFHEFELNPDLRTESINVTFDDIDKEITGKFQQYGSGVTCEFFVYYADENVHVSCWSGQLQAPNVYGWKILKTVATNGFRSRELFVPSRRHPRECTASVFAGKLPDAEAVRSSLCPYDKHLGGSVGNYKTGTTPYSDCPKTRDACIARLGGNGKYFGGFVTDASGMVTDTRNYWLAVSRGNASRLTEPIRWIFGTVHLRGCPVLLWRPERDGSDPKNSYVSAVYEIGEGPVQSISDIRVNNTFIAQMHISYAFGDRGQPRTTYQTDVSNFSSTAHVFVRSYYHDLTQPNDFNVTDLSMDCKVEGFDEVCVYTDDSPLTKTRIFSNNRVWCLLEVYKNQKAGLGHTESKFEIADWITVATHSEVTVLHTVEFADGETTDYVSQRSTFNAILEGRGVGEQIEDICRSGAISPPFENNGKITLRSFRAATSGELSAAKVFYDTGSNVNVCWRGEPDIELSQVPDNKLVNEVEVRFEEAANQGAERPLTVDDPNWKLRAGRQLGPDYFLSVPKKYLGFGITGLAEALRFAYRMLKFGEFDEGGTDNNLRVKMTVPFEQSLNLVRYDIIKIQSQILDGHTIGLGDTLETLSGNTPAPFRILRMKKISGGRCEITAQAYNHTSYSAFETTSVLATNSNPCGVANAGSFIVNGLYDYAGQSGGKASYATGSNEIVWSASKWRMYADGVQYYESNSAVNFPWLAVWTATSPDGLSPEPFVYQGEPPSAGGGTRHTITSASYNSTTGNAEITLSS